MDVKNIIQKIISFFISLFSISDGQEHDENPAQPDVTENEIEENDSSNKSASIMLHLQCRIGIAVIYFLIFVNFNFQT